VLIAGCKVVLSDRHSRKLITVLFRGLYEVYSATMRGGQLWWLDSELDARGGKLNFPTSRREWAAFRTPCYQKSPIRTRPEFPNEARTGGIALGTELPSGPKFTSNEFAGGLVEHLRRNGQLSNSSTNKNGKKADRSVRSKRDEPKDEGIVKRCCQ